MNGHKIIDPNNKSPAREEETCPICGEKTFHHCPNCLREISRYYDDTETMVLHDSRIPIKCKNCGKLFPWALRKKEQYQFTSKSNEQNALKLIDQICTRFHLIAKQLKSRHSDRTPLEINDEYDTQYLLKALLHLYFDDVRSEECTPSCVGGCSRVDFLIKEEQIIIEVKKTRKTLKTKQILDQLLVDIQRYQSHPDCKKLICFVYDPEEISARRD